MSRILKTINIDLTAASLNRAIREIERLERDLNRMCDDLVKTLTAAGVEVAKLKIFDFDALWSGELHESIQGVFFESEHCGVIYTDSPHALYVEYGTGFRGKQSPHPDAAAAQWDYDINDHGEAGWWYPADFGWYMPKQGDGRQLAWTQGMRSRPYMYNTLRWLEQNADRFAKSILDQMGA